MNITCPKCETVFDFSSKIKINKKLKCGVCNHTWEHKAFEKNIKEKEKNYNKANFKKILILNIILLLLTVLAFFIFRDYLETNNMHWRKLFIF